MTTPARIPRSIRVGPWLLDVVVDPLEWQHQFDAQLSESDSNRVVHGFTVLRDAKIYLNPANAEDSKREALLHELLHACQFAAGLPNEGQVRGEDFVTRVTPWLLDTLMRNKGLVEYLMGR